MVHLRKIGRAIGIALFIIIASFAAGISGAVLPNKERFMDNEIKIEMVDSKRNKEKKRRTEEVKIS